MSQLPGNPYEIYGTIPTGSFRIDELAAKGAEATASATLALAFEQRTESLIMFLGELEGEQRDQVEADIRTRLGLLRMAEDTILHEGIDDE